MKGKIVILYSGPTNFHKISNPANYSLPRLITYLYQNGYKVVVYNTANDEVVNENLRFVKYSFWALAKEFVGYRGKNKPLLICQSGVLKFLKACYYIKLLFKCKVIFRTGGVSHGAGYIRSKAFKRVIRERSRYLRAFDLFNSTSDGTPVKLYADAMGVPREKVITYMNGFPDPLPVNNIRENKLVCISRFSGEKNVDYVIRSFHKALPQLKEKYTLHLVGEGPEEQNLKNLVDDLGIKDHVVFEGFSRDWPRFFSTAKLVVTGLAYNTILEAIAASAVIVTVDLGEMKEIFKDFKNVHVIDYPYGGYTIQKQFYNDLVDKTAVKIVELLNSRHEAGPVYYDIAEYGWPARIRKEVEVIDKLLQGSN